jgi:hypothetical protein
VSLHSLFKRAPLRPHLLISSTSLPSSDVGKFIEACLKVEGYVVSQRAYRRSSNLWERGQTLITEDETYRSDVNQLVSTLESYGHALADDDATADLAFKMERLGDELKIAGKHGINVCLLSLFARHLRFPPWLIIVVYLPRPFTGSQGQLFRSLPRLC